MQSPLSADLENLRYIITLLCLGMSLSRSVDDHRMPQPHQSARGVAIRRPLVLPQSNSAVEFHAPRNPVRSKEFSYKVECDRMLAVGDCGLEWFPNWMALLFMVLCRGTLKRSSQRISRGCTVTINVHRLRIHTTAYTTDTTMIFVCCVFSHIARELPGASCC